MGPVLLFAQLGQEAKRHQLENLQGHRPKINDLVHTKLDVRFDYDKAWMYGKEWLTLKPHFYATDSLTLDAKGMDIKEVAIKRRHKKSIKI